MLYIILYYIILYYIILYYIILYYIILYYIILYYIILYYIIFLENVLRLEKAVNSYNMKRAVISVYKPSCNIPDRSLVYNRQVHANVVKPIYCIIDLRNSGRRNDVVTPFTFPDEWGFNLFPCREFQNRHRISRLPSS